MSSRARRPRGPYPLPARLHALGARRPLARRSGPSSRQHILRLDHSWRSTPRASRSTPAQRRARPAVRPSRLSSAAEDGSPSPRSSSRHESRHRGVVTLQGFLDQVHARRLQGRSLRRVPPGCLLAVGGADGGCQRLLGPRSCRDRGTPHRSPGTPCAPLPVRLRPVFGAPSSAAPAPGIARACTDMARRFCVAVSPVATGPAATAIVLRPELSSSEPGSRPTATLRRPAERAISTVCSRELVPTRDPRPVEPPSAAGSAVRPVDRVHLENVELRRCPPRS